MAARITNGMMYGQLFGNMQMNLAQMLNLQEQMTTQRQYFKPSDNPIAVARGLGIGTSIFENSQYIKNQEDAVSWLKASDTAFNQMLSTAQRIRELTIYAGDGALGTEELKAISAEIAQLKEELRNTANTSVAGKFLFSGLDTATKPFSYDAFGRIVYGGSSKNLNFEIENSVVSQVSFTGTDIFASSEKTYNVRSQYVPLDWTWKGREEKVQIRLGDSTIVKIQIPEQWIDEVATGNTKASDFNQFRDTDEVRGLTMDQVATLFNRSLAEGGANKLISVKVEKDQANGVQRLAFTSNTGEPLQITGWPDTDMAPLEQSIAGNTMPGATDWSANVLMGNVDVKFPVTSSGFDLYVDGTRYAIPAGYSDITQLNAALSASGVTARQVGGKVVLEAAGVKELRVDGAGAGALFGTIKSSALPDVKGLMGEVNTHGWAPDKLGKSITITVDGTPHIFNLDDYADSTKLVAAINEKIRPATGAPEVAEIINGRIVLRATGDVSVSGTGTDQLFGFPSAAGTASSLTFRIGDAVPVQIFINDGDSLDKIAEKIEAVTGMAARVSADKKQLVVVAKRDRPYPEDMLSSNDAGETLAYPQFTMNATGAALQLFDFQITQDPATDNLKGVTTSQAVRRPSDHSHIDLLDYLGMETTMKSVEFAAGQTLKVGPEGLHWRVISGNNQVDLKLPGGTPPVEYTMEQIAERLRNAGLGWLEVTVDIANPTGQNLDAEEKGLGTSNNYEAATSRLVIKAVQNMPVSFLDINGGGYADEMGLSTAIRTDNNANTVVLPTAACLDGKTPAYLKVVIGDGKTYTIKLNQKDILIVGTNNVDRNKVMEQIAKQVNEQSGMELMRVVKVNGGTDSSIFATTGEPVIISDLPVPDSSWGSYSMGIAMQMGIHSGITAGDKLPPLKDNDPLGTGTIRIRSLGRFIDIDVVAGDTIKDVLDKLRDQAGSWLEVNYFDEDMSNPNSRVMFSICAKDGSPVNMYDILGSVAQTNLKSDNVVNGTVDLRVAANWPTFANGDVLTINVAGYSHTIDLYAMQQAKGGSCTPQDLVDLINARFQDEDIRAELDKDGHLNLYSPRGYKITVDSSGTNPPNRASSIFGTNFTNAQRGGAPKAITSQLNTYRSGPNTTQANFFDVLDNLAATMEAENRKALSEFLLPQIDRFIDNLLKCRASEGALENRYSANISRFKTNEISLTELQDSVIGVDLSKVATNFAMLQAMYQASLAVVSQIIQPTLVNFLK